MPFDPITESIAHFIGAFDMIEEAARSRAEYDRFRAEKAAEKEADLLDLHSARIKAPYKFEGFDPGVGYKAPQAESLKSAPEFAPIDPANLVAPDNGPILPLKELADYIVPMAAAFNVNFVISPASSIIAVTFQTSILADQDTFGVNFPDNTAELVEVIELLQGLADWATDLSPIQLDLGPSSSNWYMSLKTVMDAAPDTGTFQLEDLSVAMFSGADATGYVVNGAIADDLPEIEDFLPVFHQDETLEEEEEAAETQGTATQSEAVSASISTDQIVVEEGAETAHDFSNDFEDNPSQWSEQDDGHHVVAGANTLVNQTNLYSNWLDAPVIVVMGDVLNFDAISQTNVIVDHDSAPSLLSATGDGGSTAVNAAGILTKESLVEEADEDADEVLSDHVDDGDDDIGAAADDDLEEPQAPIEEAEPAPTGAPENWAVTEITGNVTQINWVDQTSFITDNDRAEITTTGTKTFIGLGENESTNSADFWEIGFNYDLIVISGHIIDVNLITQTNVLLDSDIVTSAAPLADTIIEAVAVATDGIAEAVAEGLEGVLSERTDDVAVAAPKETPVADDPVADTNVANASPEVYGEDPASKVEETEATEQEPTSQTTKTDEETLEVSNASTASAVEESMTTTTAAASSATSVADTSDVLTENAAPTEGSAAPVSVTDAAPRPAVANTVDATSEAVATVSEVGPSSPTEPEDLTSEQPSPDAAPQETVADDTQTDPDQSQVQGGVSTEDNLLFNKAEIVSQGEDTTSELMGEYKELAEDFLNDEMNVSEDILDNDVFDGTELLKVLFIDGDFETINVVNQSNVLGDTDQVHLAAGEFAAGLNEEIQVTTGSNIQANFAKITDAGQASEIHAGGETYSDALIHQAELVDTSAAPTGVNLGELTSEAVAFLAEDMIEPDMANDIITSTNDAIASAMSSSDLMQQMLG